MESTHHVSRTRIATLGFFGSRSTAIAVTLVATLLAVRSDVAGAEATFTGLGDLAGGDFHSAALGVSADGSVVVGRAETEAGRRAFRWESGVLTELAGFSGVANGISADGSTIVGQAQDGAYLRGARWDDGFLTSLDPLPGSPYGQSWAFGVSADGVLAVGQGPTEYGTYALQWHVTAGPSLLGGFDQGYTSAMARDASEDHQIVVGWGITGSPARTEALRWESGITEELGFLAEDPGTFPTPFFSMATAISSDGTTIVGIASDLRFKPDPVSGEPVPTRINEPFRWTNGVMTSLFDDLDPNYLPAQSWRFAIANAVNADGSVIAGYAGGDGETAFLWRKGLGIRELRELIETDFGLDLNGWVLERAQDLSDDGRTIVGYGVNPAGDTEAFRVQLPAPEVVPGLTGLGIFFAVTCLALATFIAERRPLGQSRRNIQFASQRVGGKLAPRVGQRR